MGPHGGPHGGERWGAQGGPGAWGPLGDPGGRGGPTSLKDAKKYALQPGVNEKPISRNLKNKLFKSVLLINHMLSM